MKIFVDQMLIDPPSGWKYGFPKPYTFVWNGDHDDTEGRQQAERDWFVQQGYPANHVEMAQKHSRMWTTKLEIELPDDPTE